jgi:hypothetical protein
MTTTQLGKYELCSSLGSVATAEVCHRHCSALRREMAHADLFQPNIVIKEFYALPTR